MSSLETTREGRALLIAESGIVDRQRQTPGDAGFGAANGGKAVKSRARLAHRSLDRWQAVVACSVGIFAFWHFLDQLLAVGRHENMIRLTIDRLGSGPQLHDWIAIPLLAHGFLSVCQLVQRRRMSIGVDGLVGQLPRANYEPSRSQWLSGLAIVVFLGAHAAEFRIPRWTGDMNRADVYPQLIASLSSVWRGFPAHAVAYLVAVAVCSIYFTRGAETLLAEFGVSEKRPWLSGWAIAGGIALFLIGALATVLRATGLTLS